MWRSQQDEDQHGNGQTILFSAGTQTLSPGFYMFVQNGPVSLVDIRRGYALMGWDQVQGVADASSLMP